MQRLIYLSSAPGPMPKDELAQILKTARRNNARDGLSGLLVYHQGNFLQVIEGEIAPLEACFTRISNDARHGGIVIIARKPVDRQLFPDWSMGFAWPQDILPGNPDGVRAFDDIRRELLDIEAQDRRAGAMLRRFFRLQGDIAAE